MLLRAGIFLAIGITITALPASCSEATARFNRGLQLSAHGLKREAFREYSRAIDIDPKFADAYVERGKLELEFDQHQQAIIDLQLALKIDPNNDYGYQALARAYFEKGHLQQAMDLLSNRIKKNPKSPMLLELRGRFEMGSEHYEAALKDFDEVIKLHDFRSVIFNKRGDVLFHLKRYKEAVDSFTTAYKYDRGGDKEEILRLRARCYDKLERPDLAKKDRDAAERITDKGWGEIIKDGTF